MLKEDMEKALAGLIKEKVQESLGKSGKLPKKEAKKPVAEKPKKVDAPQVVKEALVATPRSFVLKTEKLSKRTKEAHENLYKKYVDSFNKTSSELDAANVHDAGSYSSMYRSLKMDECTNLNGMKLHELYFNNISDLASEIAVDSIPYMKLSRTFGTFENWQYDFMACAMSSREGWALTVYEPYKNVYMNICVDGHDKGIPLGAVPVVAIDMWSHSFYKDYDVDKKSYLVAMMRELNWDVIEARMVLAEKSDLDALYQIRPVYNDNPEKMLQAAQPEAPIDNIKSDDGSVSPATPPATAPSMEANVDSDRLERGY